jgi:hypothetical protein
VVVDQERTSCCSTSQPGCNGYSQESSGIGRLQIAGDRRSLAAAVRHALGAWGVTTVVLPDTAHLPTYVHSNQIRSIVVLLSAATGRPPVCQANAWVWTGFSGSDRVAIPGTAELTRCGAGRRADRSPPSPGRRVGDRPGGRQAVSGKPLGVRMNECKRSTFRLKLASLPVE